MDIRRIDDVDDITSEFIDEEFSQYDIQSVVFLFCLSKHRDRSAGGIVL